jgi:hypothetical protein
VTQGHESLQPEQTVALKAMSTSRISDSGSLVHHAREVRHGQLGYMRKQGLGRSFTITACRVEERGPAGRARTEEGGTAWPAGRRRDERHAIMTCR